MLEDARQWFHTAVQWCPSLLIRRRQHVTEYYVSTPGPWAKYACSLCDEVSDTVERRKYGNVYYILGLRFCFVVEGANEYCPVCGEPVEYKKPGDVPDIVGVGDTYQNRVDD